MALEDTQYQSSLKYYEDLQKQFTTATNGIKLDIERWYSRIAKNNDISYAAAKKLLKANELDEFKWSVEEYIKRGEENGIDKRWMKELENASARHHISYLEAMKLQMQQHAEKLFVAYEGGVSKFLNKSYADNFYRTAYEIAKGTEVGTNLAALNSREIDLLMKSPWAQDGKNFSDRIWTNKEKLINNLHTELSQHIIRGSSPHIAIDNLAASMNVSKRQAGTLIMTESAAMASRATQECFKELDVEEYEVCETLDMITCTECQDMDGKRFMMPDFQVGMTAPPFHPRCRGTTVPYFDDEFTEGEERAARDKDGKVYYVPGNMNYNEWYKKYVVNNPKALLEEKKLRNASTDQKQYENYKNLMGKEYIPKNFKDFQTVKYDGSDEFGIIKAQAKGMSYYNKALQNEPEVTKHIKSVAKQSGMNTEGLEYRLKEKDSYLRKIRGKYKPGGNEYEVKDIIRYTYTAPADEMAAKALNSIELNRNLGYNTIEIKNSWLNDKDPYNGVNTTLISPNGQKFELQYHTPESFKLKNGDMHKLYEKARLIKDRSSAEYIDLQDKMFEISDKLEVPKGIEKVK